MAKNLTTDDIRTLVEAMRTPDKDSFATAGSFLRNNWPILITLVGAIIYIPSQFSENTSINRAQDLQIERTAKEVQELSASFEAFQTAQNLANNDIVRRLDKIQTDVDTLKAK